MASPPWRPATWRRLATALVASIVEVLLVSTLVAAALAPGKVAPDERVGLATVAFGWVMQAIVAAVLAVALPFLWRRVRRPDHEAAWLAGERPPDDGVRPPNRSLSGEEEPPARW